MLFTKKKYITGILIAVVVLVFNQIIRQHLLHNQKTDAKIINLAGRQRMLSQKLNLEYYKLLIGQATTQQLNHTFKLWQQTHFGLLNGSKALNIPAITNPEIKKRLFNVGYKIAFANKIISVKPLQSKLLILNTNQAVFLNQMDAVVKDLEIDAENKFYFAIILEIFLTIFSITLIVLEIVFIYKPIIAQLNQNINEIELSESKLKAIIDSTPDSNIFISPKFKIISFNKAANNAVKTFFNRNITIGEDFKQYVIPGTEENFYRFFAACLKGEIISTERCLNMFGTQIWFCNSFYPVYDKYFKIIGVSFNVANIDKRKIAEEKNEEQFTVLKEIAWQQSHIIRSPVANILGLTSLLSYTDNQNLEEVDIFKKITFEADRLDEIINEITTKIGA